MINGVIFGLSTPDRHKHRGNIQDILKDVAPQLASQPHYPFTQLTGNNNGNFKEFVELVAGKPLDPHQERLLEALDKRKKV